MNVGGHRISNEDLAVHIKALGFQDVTPYQASGNVLLGGTANRLGEDLETELEAGLESALGYAVPVMVRTATQIRHISSLQPFPIVAPFSGGKLQVMMLKHPPDSQVAKAVLAHATGDDRLQFDEGELFWQPTGGITDSELDFAAVEKLVGVLTMRTVGTIQRIRKRLS